MIDRKTYEEGADAFKKGIVHNPYNDCGTDTQWASWNRSYHDTERDFESDRYLGPNDSAGSSSIVCDLPIIDEDGNIWQNCSGGMVCSICHQRVTAWVIHNNTYCFDDWKLR